MVKYCLRFYPKTFISERLSALELKIVFKHGEVLYEILPRIIRSALELKIFFNHYGEILLKIFFKHERIIRIFVLVRKNQNKRENEFDILNCAFRLKLFFNHYCESCLFGDVNTISAYTKHAN